jgi:hypothetical protein
MSYSVFQFIANNPGVVLIVLNIQNILILILSFIIKRQEKKLKESKLIIEEWKHNNVALAKLSKLLPRSECYDFEDY